MTARFPVATLEIMRSTETQVTSDQAPGLKEAWCLVGIRHIRDAPDPRNQSPASSESRGWVARYGRSGKHGNISSSEGD